MTFERDVAEVFLGHRLEPLSEELIAELSARGWPEADVRSMAEVGAQYSRSLNSLIFPPEL